jgi:hypothetical protein
MANAWGELSWNTGPWGEQGNATVALTGIGLTTDLGQRESWGQLEWNASTTEWGGSYIPQVAIGQQINASGQQQNLSLNSPNIDIAVEVFLNQNPLPNLTIAEGTVDPAPDVMLTGIGLTASSGTVDAYNEEGWGRDTWGSEVWGASGFWAFAPVTGIGLTANLGTVDAKPVTIASPAGIGLTVEEGIVDPSPDATVVGIGLSASVAVGSVVEADANVTTTGNALEIAQGQAELDAVTIASITGQQLNTTLNSIVAGASALVLPTGSQANIALGNINIQSWQIVDTGTTVSYTEVSTGTSVTWNNIDTAA